MLNETVTADTTIDVAELSIDSLTAKYLLLQKEGNEKWIAGKFKLATEKFAEAQTKVAKLLDKYAESMSEKERTDTTLAWLKIRLAHFKTQEKKRKTDKNEEESAQKEGQKKDIVGLIRDRNIEKHLKNL